MFKEQLKLLTRVLEEFEGKHSWDLFEAINLIGMIIYNVKELLSDYGETAFSASRLSHVDDPPMGRTLNPPLPSDLVERFGLDLIIRWADVQREPREGPDKGLSIAATIRLPWEAYWCSRIHVPQDYWKTIGRINQLLDSPVMPSECAAFLKEYLDLLGSVPAVLEKELTALSRELPNLCPDKEAFSRVNPNDFRGRFVQAMFQEVPDPADGAKKIIEFARSYLEPDRLVL